jgi:alkylation response protein AidB-like acyl-CoA dehydrogenase
MNMSTIDLSSWEKFCTTEVRKQARATDSEAHISEKIWRGIASHGFFEIFHTNSDAKLNVNGEVLFRAMEVLAEACASTFWSATISSALCGRMISELCGTLLRDRWVKQLSTGKALGCFAATERGSGSDPASYQTTVKKSGEKWILNGEKTRVSNAPNADVAVILTNEIDDVGNKLGLALVVLDLNKHAVSRARHNSLGLRGMTWGTLNFDSLAIEPEAVVTGITMQKTLQTVEWGQVIQTISALGLAHSALRTVEEFLASRLSFGKPLGEFAWIRSQLNDAHDEIEGARIYARKAVAMKARGELGGERIVIAKIFCTEASVRACEVALRCGGGWGYTTDLELERFLRDAYGNIPAGLPNDRLRELLICPRLGVDPWKAY